MPKFPHYGINRRELDEIFLVLGGTIERPRRTGDVIYRHPRMAHSVRANCRRKDSTRCLVSYVRDVYRRTLDVQPEPYEIVGG